MAVSANDTFVKSFFSPFVGSVVDSTMGPEDGASGLLGYSGIGGGSPGPGKGETGERTGSSL